MFLLYSTLNQGLKLFYSVEQSKEEIVFTLQSIKSRIETPSEEGSETVDNRVFTLQSIKSRIETF